MTPPRAAYPAGMRQPSSRSQSRPLARGSQGGARAAAGAADGAAAARTAAVREAIPTGPRYETTAAADNAALRALKGRVAAAYRKQAFEIEAMGLDGFRYWLHDTRSKIEALVLDADP